MTVMHNMIHYYDSDELDKWLDQWSWIPEKRTRRYLDSLILHIESVMEAGELLGVNHDQLNKHDMSKFDNEEFPYYVASFTNPDEGQGELPAMQILKDQFPDAWLHHIHYNEHHWQHWIFPDGYSRGSYNINGCIPMPEEYALEMVADWMGASYAYTNSWDMTNWLSKNIGKIILHPNTQEYVNEILKSIGYEMEPSYWKDPTTLGGKS